MSQAMRFCVIKMTEIDIGTIFGSLKLFKRVLKHILSCSLCSESGSQLSCERIFGYRCRSPGGLGREKKGLLYVVGQKEIDELMESWRLAKMKLCCDFVLSLC